MFSSMMGFGEEAGVIPRFCEELFSRLSRTETKEVTTVPYNNYSFTVYGWIIIIVCLTVLNASLFILKISCHLEMSYFEVYNEKIHDLLVAKDEQNLRKMPVSTTTQ